MLPRLPLYDTGQLGMGALKRTRTGATRVLKRKQSPVRVRFSAPIPPQSLSLLPSSRAYRLRRSTRCVCHGETM